jgi:hypothetical protein
VAEFAKKAELEHLILLGGDAFSMETYGVVSSPTGFWIDHQGRIVRKETGFDPEAIGELEQRIESLLALREISR